MRPTQTQSRSRYLLFSLFLLLSGPLAAEGPDVDGDSRFPRISSIRFDGLETLTEASVAHYLGLEVGGHLRPDELNGAFHDLWSRKLVDDIQIEADSTESGLQLVVHVSERPLLESVSYQGLGKVSESDIAEEVDRQKIQIREGLPLDRGELARLVAAVGQLYRDRGFRFVQIHHELEAAESGAARVVLHVEPGDRLRIASIGFEGNSVFSDTRLRWAMKKTRPSNVLNRVLKKDIFEEGQLQSDLDILKDLYREKGYKDVVIGDPEVETTDDGQRLALTIAIDEGSRWRLGDISFTGNEVFSDELLLKVVEKPKGGWLRASFLEKAEDATKALYDNNGYIFSQVEPDLKDRPDQVADVTLNIDEGDQYRLGRMEFVGNTRTRDKVLRREFRIQEEGVINLGAVQNSVYKIRQMGYFDLDPESPVEFKNFDQETQRVDVQVNGTEAERTELLFGGGWGQGEGFFGQFQARTQNFLGRGEMAAASIQLGQIRQQYDVSYSIPWFLDKPQTLGFQLFKSHYDDTPVATQRSVQERRGAVLSYGRNLRLFQSWSVSYRLADNFAMDMDADGKERIYSYSSSSLRPMWIHDSRDSRLEPTRGLRALLSLEYAGGALGGTNWFWRPEAAFSLYRPITVRPLSTVLGVNVQAGWIEPFGGRNLPPAERYFIGGPTSIRGFRTNSISLRDDAGNLIREDGFLLGGTSFLELNLEYHLLLGGPFRLVLFADAGNVFGEDRSFSLSRFRASAGAEVRVFVPMFGVPLRFGYAWNLNPLPEDQFESFQFSIGTSF